MLTPLRAIRGKCRDCCCGSVTEVRRCPCQTCSLWPYRLGHRPKAEGASTTENGGLQGDFSADEAGGIKTLGKVETCESGQLNADYSEQSGDFNGGI